MSTNITMLTLAAYCIAIVLASLLGGWLPTLVRMTHTRTQLIMSFVAGLMLGVALLHLTPHALVKLQHSVGGDSSPIDVLAQWALIGVVAMLLLLRLFHFHQHDFGDDGHDHQHQDHCDESHHDSAAHPLSWLGIAFGLGLHTLIDGIALGASVQGGTEAGAGGGFSWVSLGVFLAILLHKPLDALSITSIMQAGGWSGRSRAAANFAFATLCPLGALLFVWGVGLLDNQAYVVGCALAFSAGVFLCIALGDLLPEVHFHSHDRLKLTVMFLVGIGLAYALRFVEPASTHGILTGAHP